MKNINQIPVIYCKSMPFGFMLFIVFLVLKLTHTINWSWWWITCPLWAGFAIAFIFGAVIVMIAAFIGLMLFLFRNKLK